MCGIRLCAALLGIMLLGFGCSYLERYPEAPSFMDEYPQDNPFEEFLEDIIEAKIGIPVDLSPFSPEDGN